MYSKVNLLRLMALNATSVYMYAVAIDHVTWQTIYNLNPSYLLCLKKIKLYECEWRISAIPSSISYFLTATWNCILMSAIDFAQIISAQLYAIYKNSYFVKSIKIEFRNIYHMYFAAFSYRRRKKKKIQFSCDLENKPEFISRIYSN